LLYDFFLENKCENEITFLFLFFEISTKLPKNEYNTELKVIYGKLKFNNDDT
jgi:hypothetical protein